MDEQTFEQRIRRLQHRMYRVAVSILWNDEDAADAIQEAVLRAWQKRRALRDEGAFDVWLMRILLNECSSSSLMIPARASSFPSCSIWHNAKNRAQENVILILFAW